MVLKLTDNNAYRSATFLKTHVVTEGVTHKGVAGHCGSLAPLPGSDYHPPKPETKCVNHFSA
jgi:hypothetical protein